MIICGCWFTLLIPRPLGIAMGIVIVSERMMTELNVMMILLSLQTSR